MNRILTALGSVAPLKLGVAFLVVSLAAGAALFQKNQIITTLSPGETVKAAFDRDYRLRPYVTKVKVAGVPVGVVTGVEQTEDGLAEVAMKVERGTREKLGTAPSAWIRPTTLLGGNYYVELARGGDPEPFAAETIPVGRTKIPVELDRVLEALPPRAREGVQTSVRRLDETLGERGRRATADLLESAPDTLDPAGDVLAALRGTRPGRDLTDTVSGLHATAYVLSRREGQLDSTVRSLARTVAVLDRESGSLDATLADLPDTLSTSRAGLLDLQATLDRVPAVAREARPAVQELDTLLAEAGPVIRNARPLVADVRALARDASPTVRALVPTVEGGTDVLDDVAGPVLRRVSGPIKSMVLSPYRGTGPYAGNGDDHPFYKELGYMSSNLGNASKMTDRNGASIAFNVGVATGSVEGTPISFEQLFRRLVALRTQGVAR